VKKRRGEGGKKMKERMKEKIKKGGDKNRGAKRKKRR
jgi:hypothetical protein